VALPSELLERRPEIAAAERRVAAANAQIGVATAAFFPRLLLEATGGYQGGRLADWFTLPARFWSIGPAILQTIFDGGRRRGVKEQTVAAYDASVAVYRLNVLTAFQQVEDNLSALRLLSVEAAQQADAVAASDRYLQLAQSRYDGGITSYLEVTTAESVALVNARIAVDLLTRRMTASVNLIKALGGGWSTADLPSGPSLVFGGGEKKRAEPAPAPTPPK
jgi:NodT family efflux transporter outer membrane factor (OMF) lipoprotein